MSHIAPITAVKNDNILPEKKEKAVASFPARLTSYQSNIATSWLMVTVPITALTIIFLVMVFRYRVVHGDIPFANLRVPSTEDNKHAIYVNLNSSAILFVTSWASSLAPMLSGFIMVLASFPIARLLSYNIQKGHMNSLPTPYQLGLTIKYLDGSVLGSIWSWIVYLVSWRKTRQPQTPVLVTTSSIAILATALG
jgi:hypothetical protein